MNNEDCPICLDPVQDKITLECCHCFCEYCLKKVFVNKDLEDAQCPICRQKLRSKKRICSFPLDWYTVITAPSLKILRALVKKLSKRSKRRYLRSVKSDAIQNAIKHHRLPVIKWWYATMVPKSSIVERSYHTILATRANDVEILEYFLKTGTFSIVENKKNDLVRALSRADLPVVQLWYEKGKLSLSRLQFTNMIEATAREGKMDTLEWVMSQNIFERDGYHMSIEIFRSQHQSVLDWAVLHFHDLFKVVNIPEMLSEARSIEVLTWWKDNAYEFRYCEDPIYMACNIGKLDLLQWWSAQSKADNVQLPIDVRLYETTTDVRILDWIHIYLPLSGENLNALMDNAISLENMRLMEWCIQHTPSNWSYNYACIDLLAATGNITGLETWLHHKLDICFSADAIDCACIGGYVEVLQWWKDHNWTFRHSPRCVELALLWGHFQVAEWWIKNIPRSDYLLSYKILDENYQSNQLNTMRSTTVSWRKKIHKFFVENNIEQ